MPVEPEPVAGRMEGSLALVADWVSCLGKTADSTCSIDRALINAERASARQSTYSAADTRAENYGFKRAACKRLVHGWAVRRGFKMLVIVCMLDAEASPWHV